MKNWKEEAQRILDEKAAAEQQRLSEARLRREEEQRKAQEARVVEEARIARIRQERIVLFEALRIEQQLAQINGQILGGKGKVAKPFRLPKDAKDLSPDLIAEIALRYTTLWPSDIEPTSRVVERGGVFKKREFERWSVGHDGYGHSEYQSAWIEHAYQREIYEATGWKYSSRFSDGGSKPDLEMTIGFYSWPNSEEGRLVFDDPSSKTPFSVELGASPSKGWTIIAKHCEFEAIGPEGRTLEVRFPLSETDSGFLATLSDNTLLQICSSWLTRLESFAPKVRAAEAKKRELEARVGQRQESEVRVDNDPRPVIKGN